MDSETNGTTIPKEETPMGVEPAVEGKGKGKAPIEQIIDAAMEDDEEDEEEEDEEEPVSPCSYSL